jgi:hypothetical protein
MDPAIADILSSDIAGVLFSPTRQLVPNLNDLYELEIAFYENRLLSDEDLIRNSAYFAKIGDIYTHHFLMCTGESLKLPAHSSSRLKSFFENNLFRTGYATHGLFPYRGKFHPQMIKGLMNIMGLKPGDKVLDPMMGSGTVMVEACLMGIHSIGIDASPFCRFMSQTKIDALTMSLARARGALANYEEVFSYFQNKVGQAEQGRKTPRMQMPQGEMNVMEEVAEYAAEAQQRKLNDGERDTLSTYRFLLLAYLDSAGYATRSSRKTPLEQFRAILERYLFVAEKIQKVLAGADTELAPATILEGDARKLPLDDNSIDGIIFSPPYSFAIDYLENDAFHLRFFGVEIDRLRQIMIGLRGRNLLEKFRLYKEDMARVLSECSRVLRPHAFCTIIVGTNNNQLGKAMGISPDEVNGLHEILTDMGSNHGLNQVKVMSRQIIGISNTMRREYILLLQKT